MDTVLMLESKIYRFCFLFGCERMLYSELEGAAGDLMSDELKCYLAVVSDFSALLVNLLFMYCFESTYPLFPLGEVGDRSRVSFLRSIGCWISAYELLAV